jgi:hypothetical protein
MVIVYRAGDEQPWVNSTIAIVPPTDKGVFISLERVAKSTENKAYIWNNGHFRYCSKFRRYDHEFWI